MNKFVEMCKLLIILLIISVINCYPTSDDIDDNDIDGINDQSDFIDISHFGKSVFGFPDEDVGRLLESWSPKHGVNPEELGSYLEGDILIPKPDGRNGLTDISKRWKNGNVPFVIDALFSAQEMSLIEKALEEYHTKTCIRFKPRMGEKDYVAIVSKNTGCWAGVGNTGGRQEVNLQRPGCVTKPGTIVHELMHVLGFFHEQNRSDRDDYITVKYENIKKDTANNFFKASAQQTSPYGVGYDYGSVMHYSATAFSTNGKATIVPKESGVEIGQREELSPKDIAKLNLMYSCPQQAVYAPGGGNIGNGYAPGGQVGYHPGGYVPGQGVYYPAEGGYYPAYPAPGGYAPGGYAPPYPGYPHPGYPPYNPHGQPIDPNYPPNYYGNVYPGYYPNPYNRNPMEESNDSDDEYSESRQIHDLSEHPENMIGHDDEEYVHL